MDAVKADSAAADLDAIRKYASVPQYSLTAAPPRPTTATAVGSEAALAAVRQWTFKPATRNAEAVDAILNVTVRIGPESAH